MNTDDTNRRTARRICNEETHDADARHGPRVHHGGRDLRSGRAQEGREEGRQEEEGQEEGRRRREKRRPVSTASTRFTREPRKRPSPARPTRVQYCFSQLLPPQLTS